MAADAVTVVVALSRALSTAGVPVAADRVGEAVRALAALDPGRRDDVYWAGRLTLCRAPDDFPRYDRVFESLFAGDLPSARPRSTSSVRVVTLPVEARSDAGDDAGPADDEHDDDAMPRAAASRTELLRHRDVSTLTGEEVALLRRALSALSMPGQLRPSRRFRPATSGRIDAGRTVRDMLKDGGEVAVLRRRRHSTRPRRVVVLVDVSGSMSPYADALLRFAHAVTRRRGVHTEVFTIGTRLTRVTRELSSPDPEAAMAAVSSAVPDWSGGTRLGDLLRDFLDRWGQRGLARGAVVVVLSDGWERGDASVLRDQMSRLSRLAHRIVWANPRKAVPGYLPLAAGMAAALPHVDEFVEGHSLAAFERLARIVAGGVTSGA
ncbi:MAG: VWA domain-containing protein [Mycobacteriales bacterium]